MNIEKKRTNILTINYFDNIEIDLSKLCLIDLYLLNMHMVYAHIKKLKEENMCDFEEIIKDKSNFKNKELNVVIDRINEELNFRYIFDINNNYEYLN